MHLSPELLSLSLLEITLMVSLELPPHIKNTLAIMT
jgi:hypothetical protein